MNEQNNANQPSDRGDIAGTDQNTQEPNKHTAKQADKSFEALLELWQNQIPLVNAMQVSIEKTPDHSSWQLRAPLAPNRNHMGTAFGGSIATLATLAGWAQTWLLTPSASNYDIVIVTSQIDFVAPANADIIALVKQPTEQAAITFQHRLARKSFARLALSITIESEHKKVAQFGGKFVASLKASA